MFGVRLPELPASERLAEIWAEMGMATASPMGGVTAVTWAEIDAYDRLNGRILAVCEAQCLMDMSRAYSAARDDTNPLSIEPMERANGLCEAGSGR